MRTLSLRKETLSQLTPDDLSAVVGGAATKVCVTDPCITPSPYSLLDCYLTEHCA